MMTDAIILGKSFDSSLRGGLVESQAQIPKPSQATASTMIRISTASISSRLSLQNPPYEGD